MGNENKVWANRWKNAKSKCTVMCNGEQLNGIMCKVDYECGDGNTVML